MCKRSFISLLTHLIQSENCKNQYREEYHKLKSKKLYPSKQKESISQFNAQYYSDNKDIINTNRPCKYSINKKEINERRKMYKNKNHSNQ